MAFVCRLQDGHSFCVLWAFLYIKVWMQLMVNKLVGLVHPHHWENSLTMAVTQYQPVSIFIVLASPGKLIKDPETAKL